MPCHQYLDSLFAVKLEVVMPEVQIVSRMKEKDPLETKRPLATILRGLHKAYQSGPKDLGLLNSRRSMRCGSLPAYARVGRLTEGS